MKKLIPMKELDVLRVIVCELKRRKLLSTETQFTVDDVKGMLESEYSLFTNEPSSTRVRQLIDRLVFFGFIERRDKLDFVRGRNGNKLNLFSLTQKSIGASEEIVKVIALYSQIVSC